MISWHRVGQAVTPKTSDLPWKNAMGVQPTSVPADGEVVEIAGIRIAVDGRVGFEFCEYPHVYSAANFEPVYPQALDRLRELLAPTREQKRPFLEEMIEDRVAGLPV